MDKLQSERLKHFPNVDSLLKVSFGLMLFTIISSALVYAETLSVEVGGTSYDVDYTVTGMTVSGIESDFGFISLIITVDVPDSTGTLDITFDRSFFDSTFEGVDDDFIILADGDEATSTETNTNSQSRTLSIELPAGTADVEIIGSVFGISALEETPEETPEEAPVKDKPKTQCGPGTILKDGVCVLDERCGPGTILKNGVCVLDSTPQPAAGTGTSKGMGKELITGVIAAFAAAGTVGIILGLIAKAGKSRP